MLFVQPSGAMLKYGRHRNMSKAAVIQLQDTGPLPEVSVTLQPQISHAQMLAVRTMDLIYRLTMAAPPPRVYPGGWKAMLLEELVPQGAWTRDKKLSNSSFIGWCGSMFNSQKKKDPRSCTLPADVKTTTLCKGSCPCIRKHRTLDGWIIRVKTKPGPNCTLCPAAMFVYPGNTNKDIPKVTLGDPQPNLTWHPASSCAAESRGNKVALVLGTALPHS